ncbi:hypothetical protein [Frateuria sp. YIM B11624]|uniref:hypothetical protein n=1 Tax=Frateuria sp. YIM B11624 TaxID=3143185 RepID=UPI003C75F449
MSAQHTPGPWRIVIDGTCSAAWPHIVGPSFGEEECCAGDAIAELSSCFTEKSTRGMPGPYSKKPSRFQKTADHDQIMADARLIASAPELLEAAKAALPFLRDEASKYPDDGSNEPLEALRDLEAAIAQATGEQA